jgi:hypothetical protein
MRLLILAPLLTIPVAAEAQTVASGRWDIMSTVVELVAPGVPGFLQRMARGHSSVEHKRLSPGEGVEALLAPDPKAHCTVDSQRIADSRYAQALICPQKRNEPLRVVRVGTYDASGFVGRATVAGTTPKGALRIVLNQHTARVGN